jgi:hypothetical protein
MIGSSTGAPLPSRPAGDPRRPTPFCSLIRDARFPATVNDVVVTVGDARHQDVVDRRRHEVLGSESDGKRQIRSDRRAAGDVQTDEITMRVLCAACLGLSLAWPIESAFASDDAGRITIVRGDRPLSTEGPRLPVTEPHLAVDPRDANHLVAAAIVVRNRDLSASDCAAFVSFDGGMAWGRHDFSLLECGDPWVAIGDDGTVIVTVLGRAAGQEDRPDHLLVFRSVDGGRTWLGPLSLGTGHDHETIAVDRSVGPFKGSFYVASTNKREEPGGKTRDVAFVVRSSDGGRSFQPPTSVSLSNLSMNAQNPVVLSDGTLVASVGDYLRQTDEGAAWLERERDWVLTSSDGGKTFSIPMLVSEACFKSFGTLAVDATPGPFRDRLYWTCTSYHFEDVYLHHSSDRGERWTKPIRVNQASGTSPYVRTPSLAVNRDGVVGIAWYDGRNARERYKRDFICQEIYFTASLDGGDTFLPEMKVSSEKSCPMSPENGEAAWRWPAGGDYMGLAAAPDGQFLLVWADSRTGRYELHTATLKVKVPHER